MPFRRLAVQVLVALTALTPSIAKSLEANKTPIASTPVQPKADVIIPFELVNKMVYIRVKIGESRPLWFVLDTGDKYAVIDLSIARSLGLELGDQVPVAGAGKNVIMGHFLKNSRFSVVGLNDFTQPLFVAVPLDGLARASGHEFAGTLGFDFLSQFVAEIDYQKKILILHDKSDYHYVGTGESFPITFNQAAHPQVRAQVMDDSGSAVDATLVLDIGSAAALILNSPFVAREHFLNPERPTVHWLEGLGFGGGIDGRVGRVRGLKLGRFVLSNPVTVFSQAATGPFASDDAQGNIGAAILEKFKIILDYSRNQVILEPNSQFHKPVNYSRTGLFLVTSGQHYEIFTIAAVGEHSPASEAGLQTGDVLLVIDGHPASEYTLPRLRMRLQKAKQCDLIILREGQQFHVILKPRPLI